VNDNDLAVAAVLSGNRNFEGRINPDVKLNYLASPPLVVAYALAGRWTSTSTMSRSAPTPTASRSTADIWPGGGDRARRARPRWRKEHIVHP